MDNSGKCLQRFKVAGGSLSEYKCFQCSMYPFATRRHHEVFYYHKQVRFIYHTTCRKCLHTCYILFVATPNAMNGKIIIKCR